MKHKVTKYFWKTEDDHSQSVCEEYEDILCTVEKITLITCNLYKCIVNNSNSNFLMPKNMKKSQNIISL